MAFVINGTSPTAIRVNNGLVRTIQLNGSTIWTKPAQTVVNNSTAPYGVCGYAGYYGGYKSNAFWEGANMYGCGYYTEGSYSWFSTSNPVDLTNILSISYNIYLGNDVGSKVRAVAFGTHTSLSRTQSDFDTWTVYNNYNGGDWVTSGGHLNLFHTIDVSSVTGSHYIKVRAFIDGRYSGYAQDFYWRSCVIN